MADIVDFKPKPRLPQNPDVMSHGLAPNFHPAAQQRVAPRCEGVPQIEYGQILWLLISPTTQAQEIRGRAAELRHRATRWFAIAGGPVCCREEERESLRRRGRGCNAMADYLERVAPDYDLSPAARP